MANVNLNAITATAGRVEDGAAIAWAARGLALRMPLEEMSAAGAPQKSIQIRKSLSAGVLEAAGAGPVNAFAEGAAQHSAFFAMVSGGAFQRAPIRTPLIYATGDATAALHEEGAAIVATDVDLSGVTLVPQAAAAIVVATREAWGDLSAPGQGYIAALLRKAVATAVDAAMIAALDAPTAAATAATDDPAGIKDGLVALARTLIREPGQRFRWLVSPDAIPALVQFGRGDGIEVGIDGTGQIFGAPVYPTSALTAGDVLLLDAASVAAALIDMEVDTSGEADVELVDDTTVPAEKTLVPLWQTNSIGIRVIARFALAPMRETVAARLTLTEESS